MKLSETRHNGETLTLDNLQDSQLLDDRQAGQILGIEVSTLAVWRSTGRYNLPFIKCGRLVRYRAGDIREFLARRTRVHTDSAEV